MHAAVAVVEQAGRRRVALKGEGKGRGGQFAAQVRAAMVGHAAAAAGVEREGEEEPAFRSFDIG